MALNDAQILQAFKRTEGILHGHFLLTSGRHSDTYMQCAKLFADPKESEMLCRELAERLKEFNADIIVSPAVGGIIMGYEVARQLGVKNLFAERVVEDVVTTGGSVKEVVELASNAGCDVVAVASIVDRSNGKVEFGVPYRALLSMEVKSYEADECPLCKDGSVPYKPGSRGLK